MRENLEPRSVSSLDDLELATADDLDDLAEEYVVVPLEGKSGKVQNWVVRHATAAESLTFYETLFPKTSVQIARETQNLNSVKRQKYFENLENNLDFTKLRQKYILAVKTCVVHPSRESVKDKVDKLSMEHLEKLSNAIERDITANDAVARFPETDGDDTGQEDEAVAESASAA